MSGSPANPPRGGSNPAHGQAPPDHSRRGILKVIGANAAARLVVVPVSAVLGLAVTRLIIEQYGEADYAQYALLVGIANLIPFADLGVSAALMNAVAGAEDPRTDEHVRLTLVSSMRVLTGSAAVIVGIAAAITLTSSWNTLLGSGLTDNTGAAAAAACLVVIGVTLTVSFGQRILMALSRYYLSILIHGLQTPLVLGALLLMLSLDVDGGGYMAVVAYGATFLLTLVNLLVANRAVRPLVRCAAKDAWRVRAVRGAPVMRHSHAHAGADGRAANRDAVRPPGAQPCLRHGGPGAVQPGSADVRPSSSA